LNRKTKALSIIFVVYFAVALSMISMPKANACPGTQAVSGTYFLSGPPPPPVIRYISNNVQIWDMLNGPFTWTGDISGTGLYNGHWLVMNPETPNMKIYAISTWTISATVDGKAGILTIGGTTVATLASANGNWWIISGTGGLAKLHGEGTFHDIDISMGIYAYTGQVYFDR